MSEKRNVTPKGLLRRAQVAKSALGFIEANREYMLTGELASVTSPIIEKVDSGSLMPSIAIEEIAKAVMNHLVIQDELKITKKTVVEKKSISNYVAYVYSGTTLFDSKNFDMHQSAVSWCEKQLFDGGNDWRAEIVSSKLMIAGENMVTRISRDECIYNVLKASKGPVIHKKKSSGSLSFGVKAKNDRAKFSHG